jgi:hypothetical protein
VALITINPGRREGAFSGADGAYAATLVAIEGPRSATNSRTGEAFEAMDWTFAIEGAPDEASLVWASTSVASGPRSRMYGYLTALLGGRPPAVGQSFEAQDLVGRMALVTVRRDEDGWLKVENVSAMPQQPQPAAVPSPAPPRPSPRPVSGRPSNGAATSLRAQVGQATDGSPF